MQLWYAHPMCFSAVSLREWSVVASPHAVSKTFLGSFRRAVPVVAAAALVFFQMFGVVAVVVVVVVAVAVVVGFVCVCVCVCVWGGGGSRVQVFESSSGELTPREFRTFFLPYLIRIAEKVRGHRGGVVAALCFPSFRTIAFARFLPLMLCDAQVKANVPSLADNGPPLVVFPRGSHYALEWMCDTPYDVIGLDWSMDPASAWCVVTEMCGCCVFTQGVCARSRARSRSRLVPFVATVTVRMGAFASNAPEVPMLCVTSMHVVPVWTCACAAPCVRSAVVKGRKVLQGNFDPCALYAPAASIRDSVDAMLQGFGSHPHVVNLGHGMHPTHTPEQLGDFLAAVDELSTKQWAK
jgi:hypothetical protein